MKSNFTRMIVFDCSSTYCTSATQTCTREWFESQIDNPDTESHCVGYQMGNDADKDRLPVVCLHASFLKGVRKNANAVDSGLVMLDVDGKHVAGGIDAEKAMEGAIQKLSDYPEVVAIHLSASRTGIHVFAKKVGVGELLDEQRRLFVSLFPELPEEAFDQGDKDGARTACLVPRSYFGYLNLDELFGGSFDPRYVEFLEKLEDETTVLNQHPGFETTALNQGSGFETTPLNQGTGFEAGIANHDGNSDKGCPNQSPLSTPASSNRAISASNIVVNPSISENVLKHISEDGLMYGDILYADIVELLDRELGNQGLPGKRHASVLELCRNLAFICRDSIHMMLVLPLWARNHRECEKCIASAFAYMNGKAIPAPLQRVLTKLTGVNTDGDEAPQLPENLHPFMRAIVSKYAPFKQAPAAIMSLPMLATHCGRARFHYRNEEVHWLRFQSCLIAKSGEGKGFIGPMEEELLKLVLEADDESRAKYDEYCDEYEAAGVGKKEKNPHIGFKVLANVVTEPEMIQNLKNLKGDSCYYANHEIDSSRGTDNWCNDGGANERLSFDNDWGGKDTKTPGATSGRVRMAVNIGFSGTPVAVYKHYNNTEDGKVTRVAFSSFPKYYDKNALDRRRNQKEWNIIHAGIDKLRAEGEGEIYDVKKLMQQQLDWCAEMEIAAEMSGNSAIDTFRKRAAVMGFRAMCMLYVVDGHRITKAALEFGKWVSEYVLYQQLKFFGEKARKSNDANEKILNAPVSMLDTAQMVYSQLPEVYSYADLHSTYDRMGLKGSGYRATNKRWKERGWVMDFGNRQFKKTELGKATIARITGTG